MTSVGELAMSVGMKLIYAIILLIIKVNRYAKRTVAKIARAIPVVQELVMQNPVTILLQHTGFRILNILITLSFLRTKNHTHSINKPIILQGFIPFGNRLK